MSTLYATVDSPIGPLLVTSDGTSVTGLYMDGHKHGAIIGKDWVRDRESPPLAEAARQLTAYFAGTLKEFDLPLAPSGTEFQQKVWKELQEIGYGETLSYGEVARRIGAPNASRAVGLANGSNPISIVVPCHRVIGANGKLTGYGGGIERKAVLLDFEKAVTSGGPHSLTTSQPDLFSGARKNT